MTDHRDLTEGNVKDTAALVAASFRRRRDAADAERAGTTPVAEAAPAADPLAALRAGYAEDMPMPEVNRAPPVAAAAPAPVVEAAPARPKKSAFSLAELQGRSCSGSLDEEEEPQPEVQAKPALCPVEEAAPVRRSPAPTTPFGVSLAAGAVRHLGRGGRAQ